MMMQVCMDITSVREFLGSAEEEDVSTHQEVSDANVHQGTNCQQTSFTAKILTSVRGHPKSVRMGSAKI
ncbi:UNVERIFIED_CONTAM: hypothetical protein GTU68_033751 [Idotea baltica]|nr:hypothetical protein [Idotea baltica]